MADPAPRRLRLFEGYGVELEYMIVANGTLDVLPVCDRVIEAAAAALGRERTESHPGDVDFGELAWSNELALHVLEMKTDAPVPALEDLADRFQASVRHASDLLRPLVRMRVHRAAGPNSMWLPLFSGDADGRLRRLLGQSGGVRA